jgi:hypothetical protein
MTMTQLEADLKRVTRERLQRWFKDTCALYDMADLSEADANATIVYELLLAASTIMVMSNVSPEQAGVMLGKMVFKGKEAVRNRQQGE